MDIDTARKEFSQRFYQWSIDDWKREITEGFPFIKMADEDHKRFWLKIMDNCKTQEEQFAFIKALIKKGISKEILESCNDEFTEKDRRYVQLYHHIVNNVTMGLIDIGKFDIIQRYEAGPKLNQRRFRKCIKKALVPVFGAEYEDWDPGEWRYHTLIGPWKVITHIIAEGGIPQLEYFHDIIASEHVYLSENPCILPCFSKVWLYLIDDDIEPTVYALARFCEHFMNAVPKLLDGLVRNG
jgi:hypothetical protein